MTMLVSYEDRGEILVLMALKARIDASMSEEFKDECREFLGASHKDCAVDLSRVNFMDSSGIGALVALLKFMGRDRRLELCGLTPSVAKSMRMTRLDQVFIVRDSLETALSLRGIRAANG